VLASPHTCHHRPRSGGREGLDVGIDIETDLAVIKVDEQNLASLPFGKNVRRDVSRPNRMRSATPTQPDVSRIVHRPLS
jgi:hypothetical protein